jgi:hypothetical protein
LLRILLGHDFFIGKSRLWLAERAKYRGSHGGAPETGFKNSDTGTEARFLLLKKSEEVRQWCKLNVALFCSNRQGARVV